MSERGAEKDRMRGTGGNRFIGPDATRGGLLASINDQLGDIHEYAVETGRVLDLAEITISTQRIKSGRISVNVSADLAAAPTRDIPPGLVNPCDCRNLPTHEGGSAGCETGTEYVFPPEVGQP